MHKLFYTVFMLFSLASFSQVFQPYTWQYPALGSHQINEVRKISGSKFIAVGHAGTVLISDNDGLNWQLNQQQVIINFTAIAVLDTMNIIIGGCQTNGDTRIFKSTDGGVTYTEVYSFMNMTLSDIHFPNDSIGYAVGNPGKVLKTSDAGNTWIDISTSSLTGNIKSVCFINENLGFAGKNTTNAAMFKTENGGLTWSQVFGYSGSACYTITFLNDTLGYAGAFNSRIFRTVNGGATWMQQTTFNTNEEISAIDFMDSARGIAITNSYVYRTTNGINWSGPFISGNNFLSCALSSSGVAILGDSYGGIHRNNDLSNTYVDLNPQSGLFPFRRVKFVSQSNGWVAGDGYNILKTNNGGQTWINTNTNNAIDYLTDIAAINENKLIIATGNSSGKIIMTTNGGNSFTEQTLSTTNALNAISFPNANTGYVVGNNGVMFKSTNGGNAFTSLQSGTTSTLKEVFFVTPLIGFVVTEFGEIRKTTNGGSSWSVLNTSGMGVVAQLHFLDENTGYAISPTGVFKTTDGGNNFISAGTTCLSQIFDTHFINDSTGFVVGVSNSAQCDVSYTTNSGETWNSMLFPYAYALWGVFAFDTANVVVTGQNNTIIRVGESGIITSNSSKFSLNKIPQVFPNPSENFFYLKNVPYGIYHIYDLQGKIIHSLNVDSNEFKFDYQLLPGMYFIRNENNLFTQKFVVK